MCLFLMTQSSLVQGKGMGMDCKGFPGGVREPPPTLETSTICEKDRWHPFSALSISAGDQKWN